MNSPARIYEMSKWPAIPREATDRSGSGGVVVRFPRVTDRL